MIAPFGCQKGPEMIDRRSLISLVGLAGAGAWFRWGPTVKLDLKADSSASTVNKLPRSPHRPDLPFGADVFMNVEIRGGGFVSAGTKSRTGNWEMCGTDTATSFVRGPREDWRSALLAHTKPDMTGKPSKSEFTDGAGSYTQAIASNGVAYSTLQGYLIRSDNAFRSPARIIFGPKRMHENRGAQRLWNSKMAIDQVNPDIFVIGCRGAGELGGAYYSLDGGRTPPKRIAGIPDPLDHDKVEAPILVAVDPNDGQRWALAILGNGIFVSNAGAAGPYVLSAGSMTTCQDLHYDTFGRLWAVSLPNADQSASRTPLRVLENGRWSVAPIVQDADLKSVAVDPRNRHHIVAMNPNGGVMRTIKGIDGKWVWAEYESNIYPTPTPYHSPKRPWQDSKGKAHPGFYPSRILFDPVTPNRCHVYHGTGTLYFDLPAKWGGLEFWDTTAGIEQVVCNGGLSYEGGDHWLFGWDKGAWRMNDFTVPADRHFPEDVNFTHCWSMDHSPSKRTVVMLNNAPQSGHKSAYSVNKGPFVQFKHQHPDPWKFGGCIAAFDDRTFLWVPFNNGRAVYTDDRGETPWKYVDLGVPMDTAGIDSGWSFAMYFKKECVVASKETPGRGWLVNYGPRGFEHLRGVWQTETGPGGPWRRVLEGGIPGWQWVLYHHMVMKEVPGHADFLLMSGGPAPDHDEPLLASRDGGKTWKPLVKGPRGVGDFSFGKAKAGAKYPVVRFIGRVGDVMSGVFEIEDLDAPVLKFITDSPAGMVTDSNRCISGDMNVHGKWAYGYGGSGWRGSMKNV